MSGQASTRGGGALVPTVPEELADIYAAFLLNMPGDWEEAECPKGFMQMQALLKRTGVELPYSGPAMADPGCLYECKELLEYRRIDLHGNYPRDSPEVRSIQARLQLAAYLARAPRGFASLGKAPELAAIVSRCCFDVLRDCARDSSNSWTAKEGPQLLWLLTPAHRVCLLAEVAAGICCPGQPLPPDTPEHCAALLALLQAGGHQAQEEAMGRAGRRLGDARRRAPYLFGCLRRSQWVNPQEGLKRLMGTAHALAARVFDDSPQDTGTGGSNFISSGSSHGGGSETAGSAINGSSSSVGSKGSDPVSTKLSPASHVACALSLTLAHVVKGSAADAAAVLLIVALGWDARQLDTAGLQGPGAVGVLARAMLEVCEALSTKHAAGDVHLPWVHAVDLLVAARHKQHEQLQQQPKEEEQQQQQQQQQQEQQRGLLPQGVVQQEDHGHGSSNSSGSSGSSSSSSNNNNNSSSGAQSPASQQLPGAWLPAGHETLAMQVSAVGLALIWRFVAASEKAGGSAWERCPERAAHLLIAHEHAFERAQMHEWLACTASAKPATPHAQNADSAPAPAATAAQTAAKAAGSASAGADKPVGAKCTQHSSKWRRRHHKEQQQQRQQVDGCDAAAVPLAVQEFLQLLMRYQSELALQAAATCGTEQGRPALQCASCNGSSTASSSRSSRDSRSESSSHSSSHSREEDRIPAGTRAALADYLDYARCTHDKKHKEVQGLPDACVGVANEVMDRGFEMEETHLWGQGSRAVASVPERQRELMQRDRALQRHHEDWAAALQAMRRRGANQPCPLCADDLHGKQQVQQSGQQQGQQPQQQGQQQQQQQQRPGYEQGDADPSSGSSSRPRHGHASTANRMCAQALRDIGVVRQASTAIGAFDSSSSSSSSSRTHAAADGGPSDARCRNSSPDASNPGMHGSTENAATNSTTRNSCSSAAACQLPPATSPFFWRTLMWRLLARLKPSSAALLAELGACVHVDDPRLWKHVKESLQFTLLPLEHAADRDLFVHGNLQGLHEEQRRLLQYARAISVKFAEGGEASAIAALLSANVLMVLDPFEDALLPEQSLMEWWPSSYHQLLGRFLQEQQQRLRDGLMQESEANFAKLPLLWHMHMRQQGGGDYGSFDARLAALQHALSQLHPSELPALARRRPHMPLLLWEAPGDRLRSATTHALKHTLCQRPGCGSRLEGMYAVCQGCSAAVYCSGRCVHAHVCAHQASGGCARLRRVRAAGYQWWVLGWIPSQRLGAMCGIAHCDLQLQWCQDQVAGAWMCKRLEERHGQDELLELLGEIGGRNRGGLKGRMAAEKEGALKELLGEMGGKNRSGLKGKVGSGKEGALKNTTGQKEGALHSRGGEQQEGSEASNGQQAPMHVDVVALAENLPAEAFGPRCREWWLRAVLGLPKGSSAVAAVEVIDEIRASPVYYFSTKLQIGNHSMQVLRQGTTVAWLE